jgi:hypothetical protein
MATSVPAAGASAFAHLAKNKNDPKDEPKDPTKDDDTGDDDEHDEDEDEDDDNEVDENGKKTKKSKKTKKTEDQEDEDDDNDTKARTARQRERARISTIIGSAAGKRLPAAARRLALGGKMPRHAAVKLLRSMRADVPQGSRVDLRNRMSGVDVPNVGPGGTESNGAPGSAQALASAIVAAGKKARGES